MIISASRRTDIPAFYTPWLINRIREGYCIVPNPYNPAQIATISLKPEDVVKKFSKGILRWKTEAKFPLIHQMIGKISFETKALAENTKKFVNAVGKPHVKKLVIKSTMSPSIKIDVEKI